MSLEICRRMIEILSIPFAEKFSPEQSAILIMPGQYQNWRIEQGTKLWPRKAKHLWVAGTRDDPLYSREDVVQYVRTDSPDILCGGWAKHTLWQREWARDLLLKHQQVGHVILTTAAYHLPRCFLTFLQTLQKANCHREISLVSLLNPTGQSFTDDQVQAEIDRIGIYQKKGYVASFAQLDLFLAQRIV